jgi:hypothetical protein
MKRGASTSLAATLLFPLACGALARDPEGFDDAPGNGVTPPPFSGQLPPAAGAPVSTGPTQPTFDVGTSDVDVEQPPITVVRCDGLNTTDFGAMHLSHEWDHIILLSVDAGRGSDGSTGSFEAMEGVPCDHAVYISPCMDAYIAARPEPGGEWTECGEQCRSLGITLTSGDQVFFYDSRVELLGLLGVIDTPEEAALWARINGFRALCDQTTFLQDTNRSYLLAVGDPPRACGQDTTVVYLRIAPDGTIIELRREADRSTPGCYDTIQ